MAPSTCAWLIDGSTDTIPVLRNCSNLMPADCGQRISFFGGAADSPHQLISYDNPNADWQVVVGVQRLPEREAGPTSIEPLDTLRAKLHERDLQAGADLAAQRQLLAEDRKHSFENGEDVLDEQRPVTNGQVAHQLMQSGDYGDGPPFPLERPEAPAWRKRGPETATEFKKVDRKVIDQGTSVDFIRCFEGDRERPCGGVASCGEDMDTLTDVGIITTKSALVCPLFVTMITPKMLECSSRLWNHQRSAALHALPRGSWARQAHFL